MPAAMNVTSPNVPTLLIVNPFRAITIHARRLSMAAAFVVGRWSKIQRCSIWF
jgi:hypothetical protein